MSEIPSKPKKRPKIVPKFKKGPKYPRNLYNDRNSHET